jgi:TonB family protein
VRHLLAAAFLLRALSLSAETKGAELVKQPKPVYPEALSKAIAQGNVVLIARIDKNGTVQDAKAVWTTHELFVEPTLTAVRGWAFKPAMKDGKPVEIAANIVFPFRIKDDQGKLAGRVLPGPAISELAIYPADAAGKMSAPEGFPIRKGGDPRLRVEASIDLPPVESARSVTVRAEAVSPSAVRVPIYEDSRSLSSGAAQVPVAFSAPIGRDWEDGIWMVRFYVNKANAGTGQFWLARDPDRFDFATALKKK